MVKRKPARPPQPPPTSISGEGVRVGRQLPMGVMRHHLPRADTLWLALKNARVVVASGEGYASPRVVDKSLQLRDQAIGRPNDRLWGSRIEPSGLDASVFVALATNSAGSRDTTGPSILARRFLSGRSPRVFVGVEGIITARRASVVADELLDRMISMPFRPLPSIVRAVEADIGDSAYRLIVLGDTGYSFARALTPSDPFLLAPPMPEPVVMHTPDMEPILLDQPVF